MDISEILDSIPEEWEVLVWDNGAKVIRKWSSEWPGPWAEPEIIDRIEDLSVYGRYAAIECASDELIYVQDDDCIVERPAGDRGRLA